MSAAPIIENEIARIVTSRKAILWNVPLVQGSTCL